MMLESQATDTKRRRIFVSYRRSDSWGWTGRVYDHLCSAFGEPQVFMDVEGIEAGADFAQIVLRMVAGSDVALAVIGKSWLTATLPDGRFRLEQDDDLVRRELQAALASGVNLFPLLVDGATMPLAQQLPEALAPLAALNSFEVQPKTFLRDVERLSVVVRSLLDKIDHERKRTTAEELEDLKRERASIDDRIAVLERSTREQVSLIRDRIAVLERSIRGQVSEADTAFRQELAHGRSAVDRHNVAEKPYDAFLVYGHARDRYVAQALQHSLSQVGKSWYSKQSLRIFRDQVNLAASPSIWDAITNVVNRSKYLVYLASPESSHSPWVHRELEYWLAHRSIDQLLVVLTGGDIVWSAEANDFDWSRTTALSSVLRGRFRSEPLYVDLRWTEAGAKVALRDPRFQEAVFSLAAAIQDVPRDTLVGLDDRLRRRKRRLVAFILLVLLFLLGLFLGAFATRRLEVHRGAPNSSPEINLHTRSILEKWKKDEVDQS